MMIRDLIEVVYLIALFAGAAGLSAIATRLIIDLWDDWEERK